MPLFLSTYTNKLDKKGRISVPASFRAAVADQPFQGIIVFKSSNHPALEGFSWSTMDEISARLDEFDLFSDKQDDLATVIFGDSRQLPFDGDGRVMLPADLCEFAGITDQAAFVGMGKKFQIWAPEALATRQGSARDQVKTKGLTVPNKGGE